MRRIFSIVGIACILAACNKPQKPAATLSADAKMSQMIVGTWATPNRIVEIDADGSSTATFTNWRREKLWYQCDWMIINGSMIITVDNVVASSTNHERAGSIDRVKIISLDATNLVWQGQARIVSNNVEWKEGIEVSLRRIK